MLKLELNLFTESFGCRWKGDASFGLVSQLMLAEPPRPLQLNSASWILLLVSSKTHDYYWPDHEKDILVTYYGYRSSYRQHLSFRLPATNDHLDLYSMFSLVCITSNSDLQLKSFLQTAYLVSVNFSPFVFAFGARIFVLSPAAIHHSHGTNVRQGCQVVLYYFD